MTDPSCDMIEIIARGLSVREGRILLCRNLEQGHCYLPGGHVEPGESSQQACEREYLEETGLAVRAGDCLLVAEVRFIQEGVARHEINLVFHVEQSAGEPLPERAPSLEPKLAFVWTPMDELGISDFRPRAILGQVRALVSQSPAERSEKAVWISVEK